MPNDLLAEMMEWAAHNGLTVEPDTLMPREFIVKRSANSALARQLGLTARHMQILTRMAKGLDSAAIGTELYISHETVRTHVRGLLARLGVHDRVAAVNRAWELGILRKPGQG